VEPLISHNPIGLQGLLRDIFTLLYFYLFRIYVWDLWNKYFFNFLWDLKIFFSYRGDASGALQIINRWAAIHTLGAIDSVFTHPLPDTTAAVLTNAIYFKGAWATPFNSQYTVPGKFKYNDTHRIDVQFMRGQFDLKYVDSSRLGCRMVSIPYKYGQASMYVILPTTGDLYKIHEFASGLSVHDIRELSESATTTSVTLIMPKMRLAQTFSIRKALSDLQKQIESGFQQEMSASSPDQKNTEEGEAPTCCSSDCSSENCQTFCSSEDRVVESGEDRISFNLSGISDNKNFRINDIVEHVFLEVNEVGTVAAAVSATLVDYSGDVKDFKMDRPFVFFIEHEVTGSPLFWGTIVDPTNGNA
jgi:serpin B